MVFAPLFQGFGLTASLIVAIGAQNAFVLKQGLRRHHPMMIASICILCDCILIASGVYGLGYLVEAHPDLMVWFRIVGASFLYMYGIKSLLAARKPHAYEISMNKAPPRKLATILALLAFTFLNPHTYLDTILLIGGAGAAYPIQEKIFYILGAILASSVWFIGLTYGASKLAPHFQKPRTWQILDIGIGVLMFAIGTTLLLPLFATKVFM